MPSRADHLARLLDAHDPRDTAEARDRDRIRALLDEGEAAFDRARFEPGHVTASAFVVDLERDEILLIHHAKLGLWLQPGGHVEAEDRDVVAAAQRELREETGLEGAPRPGLLHVDIHSIPPRRDQPAHEHFDVRLLFLLPRCEVQPGSDALDARWVPRAELDHVDTDDSVRRAVARLSPRTAGG